MSTVDLKDAYYLISAYPWDRKYLRLKLGPELYKFTCLPFGLSSTSYSFTKLMKPILEKLKQSGITCVNYLDDFLILGSTRGKGMENVDCATNLLEKLSFIINKDKFFSSRYLALYKSNNNYDVIMNISSSSRRS